MENKDNNKNSQEDDSQMQNETGENNDQSDQINSSQVQQNDQQDTDMKSEVLGSSLVDADMKPSDDSIMKKDSNADAPIEIKSK